MYGKMTCTIVLTIHTLQLEVVTKLVGDMPPGCMHIYIIAKKDGQPKNLMPPTPSIGWADGGITSIHAGGMLEL